MRPYELQHLPGVSNGSPENANKRPPLPAFLAAAGGQTKEGPLSTPKREFTQKEVYRRIVTNKEVGDRTRGIYSDVLTREFMGIKDQENTPGFTPTAWQQRILDAARLKYSSVHEGEPPKNAQEEYNAYHEVFKQLLKDSNADTAREWLVTAMEVTKRQIVALEAITQAQVHVEREADEVSFTDDLEAMSAALSNESGVSVDTVRHDLLDMYNTRWSAADGKWFKRTINNFRNWLHRAYNERTVMPEENRSIRTMWDRFEREMGKKIYSTVDVTFTQGHTVNYNRTVNGQPLDEVQKQVVENLQFVGARNTGSLLGPKAEGEIARLLKDMTAAQQDAYFALFDTQLRRQNQLNLIVPDPLHPGNFRRQFSFLSEIDPGVEGVPGLPVNLDGITSLDERLNRITQGIGRRVDQEIQNVTRSKLRDDVGAHVHELEQRKQNRQLSPAEKAQQQALRAQKEAAEEVETLSTQIATLQPQIDLLAREVAPGLAARTAKETAEREKTERDRNKGKLDAEKLRKEGELSSLRESIKNTRDGLSKARTPDQISAINDQITDLGGEITRLEDDLYNPTTGISKRIDDLIDEISVRTKTSSDKDAIIQAHTEKLSEYDRLLEDQNAKTHRRNALVGQYGILNKRQIERALSRLEGITPAEQHEMDVLDTFQKEILIDEKWNAIQNRTRFEGIDDPTVARELDMAVAARQHVQPAYLMLLRTIGGTDTLKKNPEGYKRFHDLSQLITPQLFFDVYQSAPPRLARLMNAYHTAHGVLPTLIDLQVFNSALQHEGVRQAMLQEVDADFTKEILVRLIHDAEWGTLAPEHHWDAALLQELEAVSIRPDAAEIRRAEFSREVGEYEGQFMEAREIHAGFTAEHMIDIVVGETLDIAQTQAAIQAVRNALRAAGIDRDVTAADLTAGNPLHAPLTQAFTDAGLPGLSAIQQEHLINGLRRGGISAAEVEPYIRVQQAVVVAGLPRERAPYVVSVLKRAAIMSELPNRAITHEDLENPPGTLTPIGTIIDHELRSIDVVLTPGRQATLLNAIHDEPIPQLLFRDIYEHLRGTRAMGTGYDLNDHGMVAYRILLQSDLDRTVPFTAAQVTPALRTILAAEYQHIGIDINDPVNPWTNQDLAEVIESVRDAQDTRSMQILPARYQALATYTLSLGFNRDQLYDAALYLQDFIRTFSIPPTGIQPDYLITTRDERGRPLENYLLDQLDTIMPPGHPLPVLSRNQLAQLVNFSLQVRSPDIQATTIEQTQIIDRFMEKFMAHEGSYYEGAVLGVLLAELDVETAGEVERAFEALTRADTIDIAHIIDRLPEPPQHHLAERTAHIQSDGARGFIDQYNALPTTLHPVMNLEDIPGADMRRLARTVLGHRIGANAYPFTNHVEGEAAAGEQVMNAQFNRAQFDRAVQRLDTTYWGLEGTYLAAAIERALGGRTHREDALVYMQAITRRRAQAGFTTEQTVETE